MNKTNKTKTTVKLSAPKKGGVFRRSTRPAPMETVFNKTNDRGSEKLQKILAEAGMGSRREMEKLIEGGQVRLNGQVAKLGDRAAPLDRISVNNRLLTRTHVNTRLRVLLYNKPDNQICTSKDEEGRETVFKSLPLIRNGRWIMVGRLDLNTSGVLLFTNNGELANRLMHPKYAIEREYAVRVLGKVDDAMLRRLKTGVMLEDGEAKFDSIHFSGGEGANSWYHVTLHEGKNKEVRRLWESQGVTVSRLNRVRYGDLTLPPYLKMGRWEELEGEALKHLLRHVGL
jgi:23S rRNA pseudouridine2605 synthase